MASKGELPTSLLDVKAWDDVDAGFPMNNKAARSARFYISSALRLLLALCCLLVLSLKYRLGVFTSAGDDTPSLLWYDMNKSTGVCPQTAPIVNAEHFDLLSELEQEYAIKQFREYAIESLSGAVRIPTEMYDDIDPPGQDPRWDIFGQMHEYLEGRFPLVHTKLRRTKLNLYALVFHWQGSNDTLKPMLLTAHQDVVPVEQLTLDQWINPPFSGYYDGTTPLLAISNAQVHVCSR
ncbi:uncharacterized protein LAESUDRAFT_816936 [Laetiporus sulphureus 93-53]|uniref:Peptidase M20 dimerisation domain-containing protein n=1 Tax=Laetiporus sulphureus 93-53 TaxID=1314785 RepID=A0A165AQP8_9APHY|nr:uncharacterized protein LAESUDRAFT_816936 [Laetiporus sulphureus 93-53]KZS99469.1 hypothetical protein LAESUDRAFT_816936 [Laetiporus sulphureus 93-53]